MADDTPLHVTLAGDLRGNFIVVDADDDTLVLKRQSDWHASLHWRGMRPATEHEVKALLRTHGPLQRPVTARKPRPTDDD